MNNKKKIAVVLSGCGNKDGSEIHESVLTLLAIDKLGAEYKCFAPDIWQRKVFNYLTDEEIDEKRNVLLESARIARGDISPLIDFNADDFDALIFPGGLGAALNLSTFGIEGANCSVNEEVKAAVSSMLQNKKPIGALCIAPVILARLIKDSTVTIGDNIQVADNINKMGGRHKKAGHTDVVVDKELKLVTTPCYMYDSSISQIAEGSEKLVKEILNFI